MLLAREAAGPGSLRSLILDLWQRTRIDWTFATGELAAAFRRERGLGSQQRRFVAETLYGMIRHLRRIDLALARSGLRTGSRAPDALRLTAYLVLEAGLPPADAVRHAPDIDWQVVAGIDTELAREPDGARRIAATSSLPDWLAEALVAELGADGAESLARALNQRAPMTVRANLLVNDREALAAALAAEGITTTPGAHTATALHADTRANLFALASFKAGRFEVQDEGSQLIADLVAPPPRGLVVDYCAGAGGKTLAIAAAMGNKGRIVACDVAAGKIAELRKRARRNRVTTVQAIELAGGWPAALAALEGKADRVLVDAPCTGVGALRRNPEARWRLTPADLARLPGEQLAIAEQALRLVAPGGRLIYATCSLLRAENQGVIDQLLTRHRDLEPVPVKEVWGKERATPLTDADGRYLVLRPDRHGTDGFFAAVLRRRSG
ncbi:MAG TPA: RsmB/NOP family class I SAM-dependent RNA methyltransferase [Kofleriaceae bacterium]|nr:RsmB/NOP family class I SAM-dependent RNA methyltransferase [Kofleriaceae bacterium]